MRLIKKKKDVRGNGDTVVHIDDLSGSAGDRL